MGVCACGTCGAFLLYYEDSASHRLLELAHNLAERLLPSFEGTATGMPHPRVSVCVGGGVGVCEGVGVCVCVCGCVCAGVGVGG